MIKERLGYVHVSTGDMFRNAIARQDPIALQMQEYMKRGDLVPDEIIRDMLQVELGALLAQSQRPKGIILDGFPRTLKQADLLGEIMVKLKLQFTGVISLEVPEEMLVQRLLKRGTGRPDDKEDVIRERMKVYYEKTRPLEEYYAKHNALNTINGVGTIEEIFERITPVVRSWETNSPC